MTSSPLPDIPLMRRIGFLSGEPTGCQSPPALSLGVEMCWRGVLPRAMAMGISIGTDEVGVADAQAVALMTLCNQRLY